jgi:hypothetical protein
VRLSISIWRFYHADLTPNLTLTSRLDLDDFGDRPVPPPRRVLLQQVAAAMGAPWRRSAFYHFFALRFAAAALARAERAAYCLALSAHVVTLATTDPLPGGGAADGRKSTIRWSEMDHVYPGANRTINRQA